MFRFFVCAAILAAGFTGCTSDNEGPGPKPPVEPGGVVEGIPTYATFNFVIEENGATTKAMESDANETNGQFVKDLYVLIFNKGDSIEKNIYAFGGTSSNPVLKSKTVELTSGSKKIFVIANAGSRSNFKNELDLIVPGQNPAKKVTDLIKVVDLAVGSSEPVFITGSAYPPTTVPANVDGLAKLTDRAVPASNTGYVMSNAFDSRAIQTVVANVDSSTSAAGTSNSFSIAIQRAVAKAGVMYAAASTLETTDGKGSLTNVSSLLQNVNRSLYLFQHFTEAPSYPDRVTNPTDPLAIYPRSPYYELTKTGTTPNNDTAKWKNHYYDYPESDFAGVGTSILNSYYLTENTQDNATGPIGAASFIAIRGKYAPKGNNLLATPKIFNYIAGTWNAGGGDTIIFNTGLKQFTVGATATRFPTTALSLNTTDTLYQVRGIPGAVSGISDGMFFANKLTAYFVAFCANGGNPSNFDPAAYSALPAGFSTPGITSLTYNKLANNNPGVALVYEYLGGNTYYAIPLQTPSGLSASKRTGVIRNHNYKVTINSIAQIGDVSLKDLDYPPDKETSEGTAWMTVTISIENWRDVNQGSDL
jgi:hypothetical protein